jgi:hypothetical protein
MRYVDDSVDRWFAERLVEQGATHDGAVVRHLAEAALAQLPEGAVTILSTSLEGCAVAAATAALRDEPTRWARLVLGRDAPEHDGSVIVLEAVTLGDGLRTSIRNMLPAATIMDLDALSSPAALRSAA